MLSILQTIGRVATVLFVLCILAIFLIPHFAPFADIHWVGLLTYIFGIIAVVCFAIHLLGGFIGRFGKNPTEV